MKRGLGRGLDKLLGGAPSATSAAAAPLHIPVNKLRAGAFQPRRRFDKEEIKSLADSVRKQGIIQPLVVRSVSGGGYEIIAGERRWRAAQIAGLKTVPAIAREVSDREAMLFALAENIQRADLNPAEQARGIARLLEETKITHAEAAEYLGMSRPAITNLLRLLSLSAPVLRFLEEGNLEAGHARALLPLPPPRQREAARRIMDKKLSARAAESLAKKMMQDDNAPAAAAVEPDADTLRLERELSAKLSARVEIRPRAQNAQNGKLTVYYSSLAALERLLAKLKK